MHLPPHWILSTMLNDGSHGEHFVRNVFFLRFNQLPHFSLLCQLIFQWWYQGARRINVVVGGLSLEASDYYVKDMRAVDDGGGWLMICCVCVCMLAKHVGTHLLGAQRR